MAGRLIDPGMEPEPHPETGHRLVLDLMYATLGHTRHDVNRACHPRSATGQGSPEYDDPWKITSWKYSDPDCDIGYTSIPSWL